MRKQIPGNDFSIIHIKVQRTNIISPGDGSMNPVISNMELFVELVFNSRKPFTIVKKEVYLRLGRILGSIFVQLTFIVPSESSNVLCGNS